MAPNVFAVPVFVVTFRESLETAIIVSILLAFLKQTLGGPNSDPKVYRKLVWQVWLGTGVGLFICLVIAAAIIGTFYTVGRDAWQANEYYYEGAFCLFASVIITLMGAGLLRVSHLKEKWQDRLSKALETPILPKGSRFGPQWFRRLAEKYAMFVLPFITVLREGIEAIVFIAGVSFSAPATAIPLPVVIGLIVGIIAGYAIYKTGSSTKLQTFLIISTCFLYLVAAGLFSRAVWFLETQDWNDALGGDAAELGEGPGSYDIDKSVWHVNCCSPNLNGGGGWGILNAIFGWNNSATYGSVISYNAYWIAVMIGFLVLMFHEKHGHYPFLKTATSSTAALQQESTNSSAEKPASPNSHPDAIVSENSVKG